MGEWFIENIWKIIALVSPLVGWFTHKKYFQSRELKEKDLQNESTQSNVVGQNLDLYQRMLDDVEARAEAKFKKLYAEIEELEKENKELKERIKILEERN